MLTIWPAEFSSSLELMKNISFADEKIRLYDDVTHTSHAGCKNCALEQLTILESAGANLQRSCIGHLSDITDDPKAETHKEIARRGAFVAFDTVGHQLGQGDAKKIAMLMAALEAGYEDHVLLSSDFAADRETKFAGRRRLQLGDGGVPAQASVRRREGGHDPQDHGRQPEALPRLRAEQVDVAADDVFAVKFFFCAGAVEASRDPAHSLGPVAQLAEQQTLNLRVGGSIPPRLTMIC